MRRSFSKKQRILAPSYTLFNLDFVTIVLIVTGIVLFIAGVFIVIYLMSKERLSDTDLVKSQSFPSLQTQMTTRPIPITNNFQSENQIKPSISVSQTSLSLPSSKVSIEHERFVDDKFLPDTGNGFLRFGSMLIDRPLGIGLQPLDTMGPVLMKFNMCEQHWIHR
jgi:hypothetical protein